MEVRREVNQYIKQFNDRTNDADVTIMLTHLGIAFLLYTQQLNPVFHPGWFITEALREHGNSPRFWSLISLSIASGCAYCIWRMATYLKLIVYAASIGVGIFLAISVYYAYGFNILTMLILIWLVYLPTRTSRFIVQKTAKDLKSILRKLKEDDN